MKSVLFVLCCFCLLLPVEARPQDQPIKDAAFKDACGPLSCVVALYSLGVATSLERVGLECEWREPEPVTFATMHAVLNSYAEVQCEAALLTPQQLVELLQDRHTVVIMAVRKDSEEVGHSVCAIEASPDGSWIDWIDYPQMQRRVNPQELVDMWDGEALVVTTQPLRRMVRNLALMIIPTVAVFFAIRALKLRKALAHFFVFGSLMVFIGCGQQESQTAKPGPINTIKVHHQLGVIEADSPIEASIPIPNRGNKVILVGDYSTTCGCVKVLSHPKELRPGESNFLRIQYEPDARVGRNSQSVLLLNTTNNKPVAVCDITGIVRGIWCTPNVISLATISTADTVIERSILVRASGYETLHDAQITLSTDVPWASFLRDSGYEASGDTTLSTVAKFKVQIDPTEIPAGSFRGSIKAHLGTLTDSEDEHVAYVGEVAVVGEMAGFADASPPLINFGVVGGQPVTSQSKIKFQTEQDLQDLRLETEHPNITVKIVTGKRFTDEATIEALAKSHHGDENTISGRIVGTFLSSGKTFELRYFAACTQPDE